MGGDALRALLDAELTRPVPAPVAALAAALAARAGGAAAAVLYYGSTLRHDTLDGVLDFYVLLDRVEAWPGARLAALANRLLPPNVGYHADTGASTDGAPPLRAKYAVMSSAQFAARMSMQTLDTTLWARFSQPCICTWSRSPADAVAIGDSIAAAVITAAQWAARLGPARGTPSAYWRALYAATYAAELRVEKTSRGTDLVDRDLARYAALLPLAWTAAGLGHGVEAEGGLVPALAPAERARAARRWAWRRRLGKPINLLRLLKAALTFDSAADYVAWKVERHSGVQLQLSDWQRRHPLLAAPGIYLQLRRRGVLR